MGERMKIAFVGSRGYSDRAFVLYMVEEYFMSRYRIQRPEFVSGGSSVKDEAGFETSVDKLAENAIDAINSTIGGEVIEKHIFYANWNLYGKSAGFKRNELIVNMADLIVALWDGTSRGTKHTIDLAVKAGKPVDIYIRKAIS